MKYRTPPALGVAVVFSLTVISSLHAQTKTTFTRIEEKDRWHMCSDCAGAGGNATYSMKRGVSSPSLDGNSSKFSLGGSTPWSHALYYRWMSANSTASNFVYDVYYYFRNPSASGGMEFSVSQRKGYKWYRFDTQCSYVNHYWQLWDNSRGRWYKTSLPCNRPAAYKWNHLIIEAKRSNGRVLFVSVTLNGKKHYFNKSFDPKPMGSSSSSVNIHFQLNGSRYQTDYEVWGDKFKLTYW